MWPLFCLEVGALGTYLWHQLVFNVLGWGGDYWLPSVLILACGIFLLGVLFYMAVVRLASLFASKTAFPIVRLRKGLILVLSPLILLYLQFYQYYFFLHDIRPALFPISILGSLYLAIVYLLRLGTMFPDSFSVGQDRLTRLYAHDPRRFRMVLFLLGILVYAAAASGMIFPAHPLTGDEPHYLVVTQSLVRDGDLDVKNNYEQQDYLIYYPGPLDSHARPSVKRPESHYSRHLFGLPVVLAPFYLLGERLFPLGDKGLDVDESVRSRFIFLVRFPMCVMTSLLALLFFIVTLDLFQNLGISLLTWLVFSFTAPVWFFSHLIYPEITVALIFIWVYWIIYRKKEYRSLSVLWAGIGIAVLPWFGPKYIIPCGLAFVLASVQVSRSSPKAVQRICLFAVPVFLSAGLYLFFLWSLYGNFSPVSVYRGALSDEIMGASIFLDSHLTEFFFTGLGVFFDQRVGFLPYAPLYLLFIPGWVLFRRRFRQDAVFLGAILLGFWLLISWSNVLGGYCPPGRHLLSLFWMVGVFVTAALVQGRTRLRSVLSAGGISLGFAIVFLTLRDPRLLYHGPNILLHFEKSIYSQLFTSLSNSFVDFRHLAPSFFDPDRFDWIPLVLWLIVTAFVTFVYLKKARDGGPERPLLRFGWHLGLVWGLAALSVVYLFFNVQVRNGTPYSAQGYELYFQDDHHFGQELGGFWTKGGQTAAVLLYSRKRLSSLTVKLSSEVAGISTLKVDRFRRRIKRYTGPGFSSSCTFEQPTGFPWKNGYLYSLEVYEPHGFVPFQLDDTVRDNRYLGVFVQVSVGR